MEWSKLFHVDIWINFVTKVSVSIIKSYSQGFFFLILIGSPLDCQHADCSSPRMSIVSPSSATLPHYTVFNKHYSNKRMKICWSQEWKKKS